MKRRRNIDDQIDRLLSQLIRRYRRLERTLKDGTIDVVDAWSQALRLQQLGEDLAALQCEHDRLRKEASCG